MSESTVAAIVVALFAALGGSGFWVWLNGRKEAPIKKRDADIAVAHTSQQMALAVADDLRTDVTRLRADLNHERTEREGLGTKLEALQQKVEAQADTISSLRRVVRIFNDAWASLEANWQILRLQETAPSKPYINMEEEVY